MRLTPLVCVCVCVCSCQLLFVDGRILPGMFVSQVSE